MIGAYCEAIAIIFKKKHLNYSFCGYCTFGFSFIKLKLSMGKLLMYARVADFLSKEIPKVFYTPIGSHVAEFTELKKRCSLSKTQLFCI